MSALPSRKRWPGSDSLLSSHDIARQNAPAVVVDPALVAAGFGAGAVNAIAGGGPLLTLAALTAAGIDPRVANLTSTVALCPGQILAGWQSRAGLTALGDAGYSPAGALVVTLVFGAAGAGLLVATDGASFGAIVPWLVLFATALYAWSGRGNDRLRDRAIPGWAFAAGLAVSSFYGGYFGGGNSFVVLALLALAGLGARVGADGKNALVASINTGAVAVFALSGAVDWRAALSIGIGGVAGSLAGVRLLSVIRPAVVRPLVIVCGLALAGWFFVR